MHLRILLVFAAAGLLPAQPWQAGAAKVKVTPTEPIWLSGYANRTKPSEGVRQDIWVKAAAFRQNNETAVILTSDLQGFDVDMIANITTRAEKQFGLRRHQLVLNYSHNHSAPVTGKVLHLYYRLDQAQAEVVHRYTLWLQDRIVEVIGAAISNLAPAELTFEQGLAGIAVNRRRARPGGRTLFGPVDQDVPVLAIRQPNGKLRAALFGYSCHTTALSGYQINGDYAGYAQAALEKRYPEIIALFVQGCGGDANPLPRIMNSDSPEAVELASMYGAILARAVETVLKSPMQSVAGALATKYAEIQVPFTKPPNKAALEARLAKSSGFPRRQTQYLLDKLQKDGQLETSHPYPIQVIRFGTTLNFIALTGESVADYCLRFKKEYGNDSTWVAGYNNELLSYIPSLRVLREGGYEGVDDMGEYGLPAPYAEDIEERIANKVAELLKAP
jgi:neutral ceramidase